MLDITITDILTILAIFVGPFVGIYAQSWVEYYKERKARQLNIFRVLMATRADSHSKEHVRALNLIDIDFLQNKKEKPVIIAWKVLLKHLDNYPDQKDYKGKSKKYESAYEDAEKKSEKYLNDLLLVMSNFLGYAFKQEDIKDGWYATDGHGIEEEENDIIRESLVELLTGETHLNVNMKTLPKKPSGKKAKK